MSWGRGRGINNTPAWMTNTPPQQQQQQQQPQQPQQQQQQYPRDYDRFDDPGDNNNYNRPPPPPAPPQGGGYPRGGPPPRGGGQYRGGGDHRPPYYDDRGGGGGGGGYRGGGYHPNGGYGGGGPPRDAWGSGGPPARGDDRFRGGGGGGGRPPPPIGPGGGRPGMPGAVTFRSMEEERDWVEERRRKRLSRPTKFDILPSSTTMPGGGMMLSTTAAAVLMNPAVAAAAASSSSSMMMHDVSALFDTANAAAAALAGSQQTRHARRLYVGNLPVPVTEDMIHQEFKQAIEIAWANPEPLLEDPILSVYINHERRFCFLEFKTIEMATACMNLDGLTLNGQALKIKRPNDYNETTMGPGSALAGNKPIPLLDVSRLGIISGNVLDGPNKVFIGGLHYHLTEQQVLELLQAFGKVKAFHLVKGGPTTGAGSGDSISSSQIPDGNLSKGYCFVEYADPNVTATAIAGLNGMEIGGGKSITARLAGERAGGLPMLAATTVPMTPMSSSAMAQPQQAPLLQQPNPYLQQQLHHLAPHQTAMSNLPGAPPPDRNIIGGYDVEALVDAAMGNAVMPTTPMYMDALGQPLTRIVHILPPTLPLPPLPAAQPVEPPTARYAPIAAPTTTTTMTPPHIVLPDRVLVLHNMVQDEDLSTAENLQALLEEVRDECRKYGNLLAIQIPRVPDPPLVQSSALGKIYLEYATPQDANAARAELQGRQFGDAVVQVTTYPQMDFAHGKLV